MVQENKSNSRTQEAVGNSEQIVSMIMGILVVLIVGGLAYRYFQNRNQSGTIETGEGDSQTIEADAGSQMEGAQAEEETGKTTTSADGEKIYSVALGDNLWSIAEKHFKSGYNWVDIATANNLKPPYVLAVGQKLVIPEVEAKEITLVTASEEEGKKLKIDQGKYTVVEGDSLSKIAQVAYGDIFMWEVIWNANKQDIANPNLIYPGQVITIPSK